MRGLKRMVALVVMLALCLSSCPLSLTARGTLAKPESAPDFSTYTEMEGIAFTSEVANLKNGDRYIDYWDGKAYTFTVGTNVVATFEDACSITDAEVPNLFALSGNQGELLITAPVNVYGYYYDVDPNVPIVDEAVCPARNPEREAGMETIFDNIAIKEGLLGKVYIGGFTLAGSFYDSERAISDQATEIVLENVVVSQDSSASPNGSHIFIVSNANTNNNAESAAGNKDSFTLRHCRLEKVLSARISSNQIPQKYTVDGMVSVSGCTTFYGFPQWRRYITNGEFTLQNCYFENFAAADGRGYFLVMEGLNKFNGNCTINIKNNVFGGDAANYMVRVFTKVGYDINITGNTFLAKSKTAQIPLTWDVSYDTNIFSDYAANADVSKVDISSVAEIRNNRFIGYTKFDKIVNSLTVFDLSDNFFTNDLTGYKTAVGTAPTYNSGWKLDQYWADYALSVNSKTIPSLLFNHAAVQQTEGGYLLYVGSATVNLYDYGLTLPKGVTVSFSTNESYSALTLDSGANTRTFTVYSYDGTASKTYTLTLYYDAAQPDMSLRLKNAYIRLNAGCYTVESLAGYAEAIEALKRAIEQNGDVSAALAALDAAEAALA
ncbi:MAG: hypothetical protein IJN82_01680, partial [Clostridia bacterium]|nr:hypothetical protein [Clostridia bacterium]